MSSKSTAFLVALFVGMLAAQAQFKPLGFISARNYNVMMDAAERLQKAVEATKPDLRKEFLRQAGNPAGTGIDMTRPWHFVFSPPSPPSTPSITAFFVPVGNYDQFTDALEEDGMFKGSDGANVIRKSGNYAVIVQRKFGQADLDPELVKAIVDYRQQLPAEVSQVYRLHIRLSDELRGMMSGGLMMFRNMAKAQADNAPKGSPGPFAAMAPFLDLYYNLADMLVKGLSDLEIDADVTEDEIRFSERITAVAGSELEKLMAPTKSKVRHLDAHLTEGATIAFVGHLEGSEFFKKLYVQAMTLGMQMQGAGRNEEVVTKMEAMMGQMLPMTFAASVDMTPAIRVSGIYEFPNANGNQLKKDLSEFIDVSTKAQVGKDGLYSSFERKEGVRQVNGLAVDRVTAHINTNSALLKMPGQLDAFRVMWPDDKLTYEIAATERKMFYAMGKSIESVIKATDAPMKLRVQVDDQTFFAGRYNVLQLVSQWLPKQRGIPAQMADIVKTLDPKGTGVDMKASLDGTFASELVVPLKLLTQFSRFSKEMTKARRKARAAVRPDAL